MEKETLFIAFSTQKGGAGKTTLTVLVASYLHYVKGMNVAVVDCDYPQHSIAEMRKRDLKTVMEDEHYKLMAYRQLQRIRKKAYPIAESTAEDAVAKADELLSAASDVYKRQRVEHAGEHGLCLFPHCRRQGGNGKHTPLCEPAE